MPRGSLLTDEEKGVILAHYSHVLSLMEIVEEVGRSREAVTRFLKRPHPSHQPKWKARNKNLSDTAVRRIIREAAGTRNRQQR